MTVERSGEDLQSDSAVDNSAAKAAEDEKMTGSLADENATDMRESRRGATLSPQIRDRLALQLRSMYDSVANQPVPDRFAELIARLDANDRDQR